MDVGVGGFSLEGHKYDQSTYKGRLRHFFEAVNPTFLLYTEKDVKESREMLDRYKNAQLTEKEMDEKVLWRARHIIEACVHPQSGEMLPRYARLASFVPVNIPICAGMILTPPTTVNVLFWQWFNQSYNAAFNYANRNTSVENSKSDLMISYFLATGVSCALALGLGRVVKRATFLGAAAQQLVGKAVPFMAVASAGVCNAVAMRKNELSTGIAIMDADENVYGNSKAAAKKCLTEVGLTRVFIPAPILLLPPYILAGLQSYRLMPGQKVAKAATEVAVITACLWFAFPSAVALFPLTGSIDAKKLEPQFQDLKDKEGKELSTLYYHKGI